MILIDYPKPVQFRAYRRASHCMSTLAGQAGTDELVAFAIGIGLRPSWIQNQGEPTEHFDLFDGAIDRAIRAGVTVVPSRELIVRVVQPKRGAKPCEPKG